VLASNERSQKLFEKCGYTREGLLREHHFRHGAMQEVVLFGRLADDPAPTE
jgi:RimJ/RimL family protein N-acetyltransferase